MTGGLVYGIDLGTSNSAVRIVRSDGTMVWGRDPAATGAHSSVPTAVLVAADGGVVVGNAAERGKRRWPACYRTDFKRDVGSRVPIVLGERTFLAHELVAQVLRFLRERATAAVDGEPELVVVTVPASWEEGNRRLVAEAAAMAGFDPHRLCLETEPVAAAAAAFEDANPDPDSLRTLLVYDLGGGTFDCAVARTTPGGGMEVLGAPDGLDTVGGRAFDQEIARELRIRHPTEFAELAASDPDDTETIGRRLQLRTSCEEIKFQLSVATVDEPLLTELRPPVQVQVTREELAALLTPMLEETVAVCEQLLASVGLDWPDIDRIVPVGGSVRMPMVGELLARRSRRPVLKVTDPELAVAHGAALIARRLNGLEGVAGIVPARPGRAPGARTLVHDGPVRTLAFTPDGSALLTVDTTAVREWDTTTGRKLREQVGDGYGLAVAPDGAIFAMSCAGGGVALHDVATAGLLRRLGDADTSPLWRIAMSPDGRYLAAAGLRSRVFNLERDHELTGPWAPYGEVFRAVVFSPDGRFVAAGGENGAVCLSALGVGTEVIGRHDGPVRAVAFNRDGDLLATASGDGSARVWGIPDGSEKLVVDPGGRVSSVAFSPEGSRLVTGSSDGLARIWTLGGVEQPGVRHDRGVTDVAFSPDGRWLATASIDGTVRLTPTG